MVSGLILLIVVGCNGTSTVTLTPTTIPSVVPPLNPTGTDAPTLTKTATPTFPIAARTQSPTAWWSSPMPMPTTPIPTRARTLTPTLPLPTITPTPGCTVADPRGNGGIEIIQYIGEITIDFNLSGKIDQRTIRNQRECINLPAGTYSWEAKVPGRPQFGKLTGNFSVESGKISLPIVICTNKDMQLARDCVAAPGRGTSVSTRPPPSPPTPVPPPPVNTVKPP